MSAEVLAVDVGPGAASVTVSAPEGAAGREQAREAAWAVLVEQMPGALLSLLATDLYPSKVRGEVVRDDGHLVRVLTFSVTVPPA